MTLLDRMIIAYNTSLKTNDYVIISCNFILAHLFLIQILYCTYKKWKPHFLNLHDIFKSESSEKSIKKINFIIPK